MIAVVVAALTVLYNRFAKHHVFFGPLTMGMCRGGNLLLGMSVLPESFQQWSFVALLPIAYIGAITLISQDEVHGGKRRTLYIAVLLYLIVLSAQLFIAQSKGNILFALPFVLLHAWLIGRPLYNAIQNPIGPLIGKAVKAGVISLIVMNASWCVAFGLLASGFSRAGIIAIINTFSPRFCGNINNRMQGKRRKISLSGIRSFIIVFYRCKP